MSRCLLFVLLAGCSDLVGVDYEVTVTDVLDNQLNRETLCGDIACDQVVVRSVSVSALGGDLRMWSDTTPMCRTCP